MTLIVTVLVLVFAVALLRGGKLRNLTAIELRAWWLLPLSLLIQSLASYVPEEQPWSADLAVALVLGSFLMLLVLVWINRREQGLWIAGIGVLMNFTVIAANGGMPILAEAVELAGGRADFAEAVRSGELVLDPKHVLLDGDSRLAFLADIIPIPRNVVSLGDVLLIIGLGVFLEDQLRKPPVLFRHGVPGEAGSAAH